MELYPFVSKDYSYKATVVSLEFTDIRMSIKDKGGDNWVTLHSPVGGSTFNVVQSGQYKVTFDRDMVFTVWRSKTGETYRFSSQTDSIRGSVYFRINQVVVGTPQ